MNDLKPFLIGFLLLESRPIHLVYLKPKHDLWLELHCFQCRRYKNILYDVINQIRNTWILMFWALCICYSMLIYSHISITQTKSYMLLKPPPSFRWFRVLLITFDWETYSGMRMKVTSVLVYDSMQWWSWILAYDIYYRMSQKPRSSFAQTNTS